MNEIHVYIISGQREDENNIANIIGFGNSLNKSHLSEN